MKKRSLLFILLFGVLAVILFGVYYLIPNIKLLGGRVLIVDYNSKYKEPGYVVKYKNKKYKSKVKVVGEVNTKKLGIYELTYSINNSNFKRKAKRVVKVVDRKSPTIKLYAEKIINVCPGDKYKIPKYSVDDNYDGDLTKKLKIDKNEHRIIYSISDSSKNKTKIIKHIHYRDVESPEIFLVGDEKVFLHVGDTYKEEGVIVSDNCDKDLEKSVEIDGSVDTSKVSKYTITYRVADKSGNKASKKRIVSVSERPKGGIIYLTFDDGPNEGTTNVILDILKEEGVKATFFVTNKGPDDLILREYNEGHTVAMHTASHDYSYVYSSAENYYADLQAVHDRIYNITGYDSKILRFPGGSSNTISRRYQQGIMSFLTEDVVKKGYKYYDWNLSSGDAGGANTPDAVYQNVVNGLSRDRANMVLMHDIKTYTRDAIRSIIRYGKDNGYTFLPIDYSVDMVTQRVNN